MVRKSNILMAFDSVMLLSVIDTMRGFFNIAGFGLERTGLDPEDKIDFAAWGSVVGEGVFLMGILLYFVLRTIEQKKVERSSLVLGFVTILSGIAFLTGLGALEAFDNVLVVAERHTLALFSTLFVGFSTFATRTLVGSLKKKDESLGDLPAFHSLNFLLLLDGIRNLVDLGSLGLGEADVFHDPVVGNFTESALCPSRIPVDDFDLAPAGLFLGESVFVGGFMVFYCCLRCCEVPLRCNLSTHEKAGWRAQFAWLLPLAASAVAIYASKRSHCFPENAGSGKALAGLSAAASIGLTRWFAGRFVANEQRCNSLKIR